MPGGDTLRSAMRRFASGVAAVTVDDDGQRLGVTVGSLVSLSLEPPLVGISIGHQSSLHAPLRRAGRFAVSLLAGDQEDIAQNLARSAPPIALWTLVPTRSAAATEPLIEGALAWLSCRVTHECEAGDHTLFVAEVVELELGRDEKALVYTRGEYRSA